MTSRVSAVHDTAISSDWTITSFDGTPIRIHWFPVDRSSSGRAPTIIYGPGWSFPGSVDTTSGPITVYRDAGYNVLTFDPRGFGKSGGQAEVDSPGVEARDMSRIIDWIAGRLDAELDHPGDPRVGMVGASYGGGIQWVTAATDCRVDAIAPGASWNSLATSLEENGTFKAGWDNFLVGLTAGHRIDPHIARAIAEGNNTGQFSGASLRWFAQRGPGALVKRVRVPTLIEQGTVDNLFTLQQGIENFRLLGESNVPRAMLWFCGGHGVCLTKAGPSDFVQHVELAWMNRWVKHQHTATGPTVSLVDQNGVRYAANGYPLPVGHPLQAVGAGTLRLLASGGAGPAPALPPGDSNPLDSIFLKFAPAKANNAVNLVIRSPRGGALLVGAPQLTLDYRGRAQQTNRAARVFAQLVDNSDHVVVGNQITPVPLTLDGKSHEVKVPLEAISEALTRGQSLTLQLVATTVAYATPRLGGTVKFSRTAISLPTVRPGSVPRLQ